MTLLVLAVLLALATSAWVIHPLWIGRTAPVGDAEPGEIIDARARRGTALASLKEVEYDYLAGKLDERDYHAMRDRLSAEALRALDTAERVEHGGTTASPEAEAIVEALHACGFANAPGSRFCAGCGTRLT